MMRARLKQSFSRTQGKGNANLGHVNKWCFFYKTWGVEELINMHKFGHGEVKSVTDQYQQLELPDLSHPNIHALIALVAGVHNCTCMARIVGSIAVVFLNKSSWFHKTWKNIINIKPYFSDGNGQHDAYSSK